MQTTILEKLDEIKSLLVKKVETHYLDMRQVENYTSLSQSTIRRAIQKGELKCSNKTGKLLFKKSALDKWLNNG